MWKPQSYATLIHFASQYIPKTASWSHLPLNLPSNSCSTNAHSKNANLPTPARGAWHYGEGPQLCLVPLNLGKLCWRQPVGTERWPVTGPQIVAAPAQTKPLYCGMPGDITQMLSPPACKKSIFSRVLNLRIHHPDTCIETTAIMARVRWISQQTGV